MVFQRICWLYKKIESEIVVTFWLTCSQSCNVVTLHKRQTTFSKLDIAFLSSLPTSRCLKITEKVSFNIASEVSYVYILIGQKLILAIFWNSETSGQAVLPDRSLLIGQKLLENAKKCQNSNATFWVIFKQCANIKNDPMPQFQYLKIIPDPFFSC